MVTLFAREKPRPSKPPKPRPTPKPSKPPWNRPIKKGK